MGPSASTCSVRVNAAKMQQAFTNILDNAHQHSPDGSPIRIQLQKTTQGTITISFIDFGSGIDPANFSRVFEPFYTTRRDGSGLGMSITRYILTRHGGTIKVYNTPGGAGLSVEVCLPLTES